MLPASDAVGRTPGRNPSDRRTPPRRDPRRLAAALPMAMVLVLSACAPAGTPEGARPAGGAADGDGARDTTLARIVNREEFQMHVHLVAGGRETFLGTVPPLDSATFELPENLSGPRREVRFRGDPVGSLQPFVSDQIYVPEGEVVRWTIQRP